MLFTCVLIGLSSAPIFAASEDPLSSEVSSDFELVVPEEYKDPVYNKLASGDVRATTYTTTDIYNLLTSALAGDNYMSAYSLPRITSYLNRISQILYGSGQSVPSQSLYANLREIHYILNGNYSGVSVRPDIQSSLYRFDSDLNTVTVSEDLGSLLDQVNNIAGYSAQIHGDGQNNSYYLSNIDSDLSILESSWTPFNITYNGWSSTLNGTYDTSTNPANGYNKTVFFKFTNSSGANTYRFSRLLLNMINTGISDSSRVTVYAPVGNSMYEFPSDTSYLMGRYVYLTDLPNNFATNQSFILKIDFDYVSFTTTKNMTAEYIPDSVYSLLSNAELDLRLINRQFSSIDSNLSTLTKYLADPDKVAAEQASQQVIDDTLDGFTGNGTAAAKTSDTGSMKNMSGSIQSGLNSGASASNAASVFSNQTFWSWFTQATSNGINNAYPAPVVQNTRGSGDDIPDFLSGNQAELNDLLNQRNSW